MYSINSLEKAYLEWFGSAASALERSDPAACGHGPCRSKVEALIDEMERYDPGRLRWGKAAYNYNVLRAHVGLDEVSA